MMVTYALTRSPRRVTPSGHVTSSYGLRSTAGARRASASATSIVSLRIACVPTMTSVTPASAPAAAAVGCGPAHGRVDPAAVAPLFDLEVRISIRRNRRQVRDAQYREGGTQRSQLAADDVGDATADAGIDLVEDQSGGRRAGPAIGGVAEPVARRGGQRLDREH